MFVHSLEDTNSLDTKSALVSDHLLGSNSFSSNFVETDFFEMLTLNEGPYHDPSATLMPTGSLQISPVRSKHSGKYTCVGENEAGTTNNSFVLSVRSKLISIFPLLFLA